MTQIPVGAGWSKSKLIAELSRTNEYLQFAAKLKLPSHSYGVKRATDYKARLLAALEAKGVSL